MLFVPDYHTSFERERKKTTKKWCCKKVVVCNFCEQTKEEEISMIMPKIRNEKNLIGIKKLNKFASISRPYLKKNWVEGGAKCVIWALLYVYINYFILYFIK